MGNCAWNLFVDLFFVHFYMFFAVILICDKCIRCSMTVWNSLLERVLCFLSASFNEGLLSSFRLLLFTLNVLSKTTLKSHPYTLCETPVPTSWNDHHHVWLLIKCPYYESLYYYHKLFSRKPFLCVWRALHFQRNSSVWLLPSFHSSNLNPKKV